jgi:hypothetical protein
MTLRDQSDEERIKFLGYITPIIIDYAENNKIDPAVCYEVCHHLELMMIEKCKERGINDSELEYHKKIAETNFEESESID